MHDASASRLSSKSSPVKKVYVSEGAKIKDLAYEGNPKYQYQLGNLYYTGHQRIGIKQSYTNAFKWYKKAARQGQAEAMHNIGFLYLKGYGVDEDLYLAMAWFKLSKKYGSQTAARTLKKLQPTLDEFDEEETLEVADNIILIEDTFKKKFRKN
jgi:TPR repeat protein